ncbi:MAG TPA: hypothetical protein VJ672_01015 [Gemmatimonadaceae bacterium]|nr:hypothetical protein [Gemmatimonadaceae bacterium]
MTLAALAFAPVALDAQGPDSTMAAAVDRQMSGGPFNHPAHIEHTPIRPATRDDSLRARAVVDSVRKALAAYKDIEKAKRDGFQIFAPEVRGQKVFHFNNYAWAMANEVNFDPAKPSSLLYERTASGRWKLVGVMYTANSESSLEELDRRVPLGIARWHRHVNFCVPASGGRERWNEKRNGVPIFGPMGVATRGECEALGGRFIPRVFGWMVHASAFAGDDPKVIWGDHAQSGHEH